MLNEKQRDVLANSAIKVAEYIILTLIIGQLALGRTDVGLFAYSICMAGIIYLWTLFVLREVKGGC